VFSSFPFAKEVSSLLGSLASRCGNDFVVSSEPEGEKSFKVGGEPPTPPSFFLFSPFLFFCGARECAGSERTEDEEEEEGAIWRAGSRHTLTFDVHLDVEKAGKSRRLKEEKRKEDEIDEDQAMKCAGLRRGDQVCTITT